MIVYLAAFATGLLIGAIGASLIYHNNIAEAQALIAQLQAAAKKV